MNSNTYEIVRKAIIEKKQIVAEYQGHKREMCPHVIGKKYGENQALFYQFGGTSSSGISFKARKKTGDASKLMS